MPTLTEILACLEANSARCTYCAVAEFLDDGAQNVLNNHPRNRFHRWIVAANGNREGFPNIDYPPELILEDRYVNSEILTTAGDLEAFLRQHGLAE